MNDRASSRSVAALDQIAGVYNWAVGDIWISAVADGYGLLPLQTVPQAGADEAKRLAGAAFLPPGDMPIAVNTFLIRTGSTLALVDTGAGTFFGAGAGKLWENLRAAKVEPSSVNALILTHLHPDHALGMTTKDGAAAFPNAELIIHQRELAFWLDDANLARAADFEKPLFQMARNAVAAYGKRVTLLERDGQPVVRGVEARELPGHTPGHTGLHISSGDDQLFIWGDIVHLPHLQFPRPDWGMAFDVDTDQAAATRARIFDMTATDRIAVTGMHLNYPGFGHVVRGAGAAYSFIPSTWRYDL